MHICYISQEYPPETGWGGIGTYTYEMAHALTRLGHKVTVMARAVDQETTIDDKGVTVHRIAPSPDWNRLPAGWHLNGYWPGFAWSAAQTLRKWSSRHQIDVVEAAEGRADSLFVELSRRRPPVVLRLHTAKVFVDRMNGVSPRRKDRFGYWLEKQVLLRADRVTAPSKSISELTGTWVNLAGRSVSVIPNPVNEQMFCPSRRRREQEVLYVGRLETRKGLSTIERAIPRVLAQEPNASFRFLGADGEDEAGRPWSERLRASVSETEHCRLRFETVSRSQLPHRYCTAAAVIVPSPWENFPYAALEAMACETPVIASQAGGLPELISSEETGLLIPPRDADALAEAILRVLRDADLGKRLGTGARRKVEREYGADRVASRMAELYSKVVPNA